MQMKAWKDPAWQRICRESLSKTACPDCQMPNKGCDAGYFQDCSWNKDAMGCCGVNVKPSRLELGLSAVEPTASSVDFKY
ncbi:hypothetical protein AVEN_91503-1 [Araneus ventricosus]|uniref:Uncharacterized protein n=1 Tax=Araneus ventricosus TaxID=182803 RepID=A0A4Y2BL89_ARAVE|nr:hypothetical protein AVEN_91503-1 [Araneus ventricosus]